MNAAGQELLDRMKSTQKKTEYMKFRAMYLFKIEHKKGPEVATIIGTKADNIYQWSHRYNKLGIDGLVNKPKGGRRTAFMSLEEEKALLDGLKEDASKGLIIMTKLIKEAAEKKLGHSVSADYAEDLLNRHGWRKIMPRPKHPKSSQEEQEEFKKKVEKSLVR
jgi:transposase